MPPTLGITHHHLAIGIINLAVEVRLLGLLLADHGEPARRCRIGFDARGHVAPADLIGPIVETGLLGIGIDPDMSDLTIIPRPLPPFTLGWGPFLRFHG
jgi:hypothetical protein